MWTELENGDYKETTTGIIISRDEYPDLWQKIRDAVHGKGD